MRAINNEDLTFENVTVLNICNCIQSNFVIFRDKESKIGIKLLQTILISDIMLESQHPISGMLESYFVIK